MKRKSDNANGQAVLRNYPAVRCILHASGIQHGNFTSLSNVKKSATEKLSQLHNIRHRRLMESGNLPNRMDPSSKMSVTRFQRLLLVQLWKQLAITEAVTESLVKTRIG